MKIYTKTGDTGETSLLGGKRVAKNCIEIDAIGEVDELNSAVGILISILPATMQKGVKDRLTQVQHQLFTVGSNLAAVQTDLVNVPTLKPEDVTALESWIDALEFDLKPLTQFILPGGHPTAAQSFFARSVCRRAERRVVELNKKTPLDPLLQQYLNRLSDALFVFGRWINLKTKSGETTWEK